MNKIAKLAVSFDNLFGVIMGEGFKSSTDQILKEYPGYYTHYILTSRM